METNALVSILIPVFKVENLISTCAKSLFEQTYNNIEYIFVDDCSPDNSIKVLETVMLEYPSRASKVKIIRHSVNKGLAAARNTAVNAAHGEFIMHVDSDDYIEKETVAHLVKKAVVDKLDIVICDIFVDSKNTRVIRRHIDIEDKEVYLRALLTKTVPPSIWGKLFNADLYENVRAVEHVDHGEDYATVPRLVYYAHSIGNLHEPLYHYTLLNNNAYTKNVSLHSIEQMIQADQILSDFFLSTPGHTDFNETLIIAKLRTKVNLLKRCRIELFDKINSLYPDLTTHYKRKLPIGDRILLDLVEKKYYKLAVIYIKLGFKILNILKYASFS